MDALRQRLEQRERQIAAMQRISDALFSHLEVDALVRETLLVAIDVLEAEAGTVMLHRPEDDSLEFRYVLGPSATQLIGFAMPSEEGIAGRVFHSGEADLTHDVRTRPEFNPAVDQSTGFHTTSLLTVPLKRPEGDPIGVMQVVNARERPFAASDLEVLQVLAGQAASAVERARLADAARRAEIVNVLGDISHDIKNILTPIQTGIWTIQPLLEDLFDAVERGPEEVLDAVRTVRDRVPWILSLCLEAAQDLQSRTREIADCVKGELSPPHFEESWLNDTARDVRRSLSGVADEAEVALCLDLDEALPRTRFDRRQMYNALYNLVNNALPETPAGGCVTIRTASAGGGVRVVVEDTGRGMAPEVRDSLFTDRCVSTKPGGTGLGTRIVAGVVRRHNGVIEVDSEPGRGSRFTIHLPQMS